MRFFCAQFVGAIVWGALLVAWGCGDVPVSDEQPPVDLPTEGEPLPTQLGEYGLYPEAPELAAVGGGALPYQPRWPLWSNGGDKDRLLVIPEASRDAIERLEVGDRDLPQPAALPVGSFFFKTFSFPVGPAKELRPIETRVMRKTQEGWKFARYLWDEQGADARLLDDRLPVEVPVELSDGSAFEHQVPTPLDCRTCHEAAADPVLGYDARQLGSGELEAAPNPETQDIMGYLVGNCVHCHNGGDRENASFDLRPAVFLENVIDCPTESSASGAGIRVAPGDPEGSVLWTALSGGDSARGIKAMPTLGVQHVDEVALERMRAWIERLPEWNDETGEACSKCERSR